MYLRHYRILFYITKKKMQKNIVGSAKPTTYGNHNTLFLYTYIYPIFCSRD